MMRAWAEVERRHTDATKANCRTIFLPATWRAIANYSHLGARLKLRIQFVGRALFFFAMRLAPGGRLQS
jgi:hypothetical protein